MFRVYTPAQAVSQYKIHLYDVKHELHEKHNSSAMVNFKLELLAFGLDPRCSGGSWLDLGNQSACFAEIP